MTCRPAITRLLSERALVFEPADLILRLVAAAPPELVRVPSRGLSEEGPREPAAASLEFG